MLASARVGVLQELFAVLAQELHRLVAFDVRTQDDAGGKSALLTMMSALESSR